MSSGLDEILATISGMEQRKAALLQELEVLDQKLFKVGGHPATLQPSSWHTAAVILPHCSRFHPCCWLDWTEVRLAASLAAVFAFDYVRR